MNGDRVLSREEFLAGLAGEDDGLDRSPVLSPEEFIAGIQDVTPGKPGVLRSLATGAVEGAAAGMDMADALARNALGADEAFRVKTNSDAYYLDLPPQAEAGPNIFTDAASALRQTAAGLTPPEQVGRGNMFTEGLPKLGGQVLPGVALGAANPAAGAAYFGAQAGPTYFEILQEGGSPDQAMVGMLGNATIMQLERFGFGGALTRALKRVGATKLGEATLGKIGAYVAAGGAKEVGTEVLEQIGHDLILAGMTDAEVNILDNAIAVAKTPEIWALGKVGAGAELATRRGAQTAPAAPGAGQATPVTAQRPTEPIAPQRAPIAPGAVQQPQAPAGPALPPAEAPMLGEGGERGLVPAPRQIGPGEAEAPAQAEPLALPGTVPGTDPGTVPGQAPQVEQQQALTAEPEPQPSGIPGGLPAPDPVGSEPVRAEEPSKNLPDWVRDNISQDVAEANKRGISDRIEELSAERLTAKEVAERLNDEQGLTGAEERRKTARLVRSVRAVRGIPSMDSGAEFEAWLAARKKPVATPAEQPAPSAEVPKKTSEEFPLAGEVVDGRTVRKDVPNLGSISSSLTDYEELPGIRDVPMSAFPGLTGRHYSVKGTKRIEELADQIKASGEINPLIVVVDDKGPYILEGNTRGEALYKLGAKSFPAVVVRDLAPPAASQAAMKEAPPVHVPTSAPSEPAKPPLRVGDKARLAGVDVTLVDRQELGGMAYEIHRANSGNKAVIRTIDTDSGKTAQITTYPTWNAAQRAYSKAIEAEGGKPSAEVPTPPVQEPAKFTPPETAPEVKAQTAPEATGQSEELPPEPQKTTSIKNAVVDRELEQMGLPPAKHGDKVTDLERHGKAMSALKEDPQSGARLVDELERSPRPPSGDEGALLALEVNRLINERDAAQEAFNADPTEANQARIDKAAKEYARAADVVTKSGTESSASLRIRKMMIARDYSLAAMERSFQAAKGGIPLTAEEQTQVRDLAAKLKESEKALEDYRKEVQPRLTELEELKASGETKGKRARRQRSIIESKKRIDEILNKLGGQQKAAAGLDLEKVKLVGELAYESLKLGYNSFALWSDDMVARAGEGIRPYLKGAWDEASAKRDEEMIGRYKSRKRGDIERIKAKGEAGAFDKPRKTPIEKDPEALKLKADYEEARRKFETLKEKARLAHQTKGDKALGIAKEFLDFPRAVLSSFDISAPGRQGMFFLLGHPIASARHVKRMFHALGSERKALEIDVELRNRPTYALGEAAGLELTRGSGDIGPREETMHSRFSEKIPGVKASNRAFTTFINVQRAHMFDRMVGALPTDKPTLEQAKAIARFVNIATGRGDPGKFGSALDASGMVLWSPRLLLSRFQILAPTHLRKGDMGTRKAVAKEYARSLAGLAAIYSAVSMFDMLDDEDDVTVETDPRSSDFGKFRIGNVRIDPLAGLSQVSVLASRLVTGEKKSGTGRITPIRGDKVPYGGDTSTSIAGRFLRTKFGPVAAAVTDLVEGENVVGQPAEYGNLPKNLLVPLSFKDVDESLRELGIPKTVALTLLNMFGVGVQNYDTAKKDTQ